MEHLMRFAFRVVGSLCFIAAGISRVVGELIKFIGIGFSFAGGFLIGLSEFLCEKGEEWLGKEPELEDAEKIEVEVVKEYPELEEE